MQFVINDRFLVIQMQFKYISTRFNVECFSVNESIIAFSMKYSVNLVS